MVLEFVFIFFFFFLMLRPPPSFTLFPYTTLFRSRTSLGRYLRSPTRRRRRRFAQPDRTRRDRKSTRLNSSHMSISYAVFCLKKKKKKCTRLHFFKKKKKKKSN